MLLYKTEKARAELLPGIRSLSQRERSLLLLIDGRRTAPELLSLLGSGAAPLLEKLLNEGYLAHQEVPSEAATASDAAPSPPTATSEEAPATTGTPSLAAARMFLFDMSERLFARREPELAERFRLALRDAREVEPMIAVGADMIATVEAMGAPERADAIRQQIERLLPA